jgi:hypothetical protein
MEDPLSCLLLGPHPEAFPNASAFLPFDVSMFVHVLFSSLEMTLEGKWFER